MTKPLPDLQAVEAKCTVCNGRGHVADYVGLEMKPVQMDCERCCGTGKAKHDFDLCRCGDYRYQHVNGIGRCLLYDLCTPHGCVKFRLSRTALTSTTEATRNRARRNAQFHEDQES